MEAFLQARNISAWSTDASKIETLLLGLFGPDWKDFTYIPSLTLPPDEAFESRQGNCLTFAMLFITLARAVGVDAVFNELDVSPSWTMEGDIVVEAGHINIMVESGGHHHIVEWDDAYKDFASLVIHPISDQRAFSHYFNNLGIQALSAKDYPRAKILFEEALELDSANADAWQNYGVYWMRQHIPGKAEEAFLEGIKVSGKRSSLYFMLSKFYDSRGDDDRAKIYLKKGEQYAKNNPFYHFDKAIEARERGDEQRAVESLKTAIKKLPGYHLFHHELADCYYRLGKMAEWREAMEQAIQCTDLPEVQQVYQAEIDRILGVTPDPESPQDTSTLSDASSPDGP